MTQTNPQRVSVYSRPKFIQPQRIPEGFLLVDPEQVWSWRKYIFQLPFTVIWVIIALFYLRLGFRDLPSDRWALLTIIISGVFALAGLLWLAELIIRILLNSRFFPGELVLPRFPLRLGEECQVRYHRRLRRGQTQQPAKVSAKLVCYEWVRYQQGSGTDASTQIVWEQSLPARDILSGTSKLEYDCKIQIPRQGPSSFEAKDNLISWELQVSLDLPGLLADRSTFGLTVEPVMA